MSIGAFGENFPYSNFHDLNMDWIIKIAKDFLDQYTNIQTIITEGEEGIRTLTNEELERVLADLNTWYNTHQGYLNQYLVDSINSFNTQADQKTQESIASIPSDYTALSNQANNTENALNAQVYGKIIEHDETVTTMQAYNLQFSPPIPSGVPLIFTNTSSNSVMSLGVYNSEGVETRLSNGLIINQSYLYFTEFPVYGIRNFVNGTEWKFRIVYGENIKEVLRSLLQGTTMINNVGEHHTIVSASDLIPGYINKNNGYFGGSGDGGYHTNKLEIDKYPVIFLSASKQQLTALCTIYDENQAYIATVDDNSTTEPITVTDWMVDFTSVRKTYPRAKYFACGTYPSSDNFALYSKDAVQLEQYINTKISDNNPQISCACLGDSRTEKLYYVTKSYPEVIKELKRYKEVYNWGVSGATYVPVTGRTSAYEIVSAHDFSDVDVVTLNFGFNDYGRSLPIGEPGDTTDSTVCGAVYKCLNKIYTDNPKCYIVVFAPLPNNNVVNSANDEINFQRYVDAIKATCQKYTVSFYDSWKEGAISRFQASAFFDYDTSHATDYTVFGTWMATKLP